MRVESVATGAHNLSTNGPGSQLQGMTVSMQLTINGKAKKFNAPLTVAQLLDCIGLDPRKIAVERNLEIVPKSGYAGVGLEDGDSLEIVHFIGGGAPDGPALADNDPLVIAGRSFTSRLIIGTGKYKDYETNRLAT